MFDPGQPFNGFFDLAQWSALVGFGLPWVIAFLKQSGWSARTNSVIAFLSCFVTGLIVAAANGAITLETWATSGIVVFIAAQATYKGLWQKLGEPELEHQTSVVKASSLDFADTGERDGGV